MPRERATACALNCRYTRFEDADSALAAVRFGAGSEGVRFGAVCFDGGGAGVRSGPDSGAGVVRFGGAGAVMAHAGTRTHLAYLFWSAVGGGLLDGRTHLTNSSTRTAAST